MARSEESEYPVLGNRNPMPLVLTEEERIVMKECENESFFRRALPLSLGTVVGIQYLTRTGKLTAHPKLGPTPMSFVAGGLAFIFGKISYLPQCRKKILERIPDSHLAQSIKRNGGHYQQEGRSEIDQPMGQAPVGDREDYKRKISTDGIPSYEGLSDSNRPSLDNEVKTPNDPEKKESITHEDLRRRNRQEYKDNQSAPRQTETPSYKDSPLMPQKPWPDKKPEQPDSYQAPPKRKRTNMWGDVIED